MGQIDKIGAKAIGASLSVTPYDDVALLCDTGFDAFFTPWDKDIVPRYAAAAKELGCLYASIHSECNPFYLWKGTDPGRTEFERSVLEIETCARYEIPILAMHPSVDFIPPKPTVLGLQRLETLLCTAERYGVVIAFENMGSEACLSFVMNAFDAFPSCGFCYDTGHALAYTGGIDFAARYPQKLCLTHLHDNFGKRGERLTSRDDLHLLPFDGAVDWNRVMTSLHAADYHGILMSEVKYTPKEGNFIYDRYHAPTLRQFYTLVYERLKRLQNL
jgi:sugar phosphate isomerase/epimerase